VPPSLPAAAIAAALFVLAAGCGSAPEPAPAVPALETEDLAAAAERYVDIVLALRARDRDSVDFYAGPRQRFLAAEKRNLTFPEIRTAAIELRDRLATQAGDEVEQERRDFMIRQLDAVAARVDLLRGVRWSFDDESRVFFDVTLDEGDRASADRARAELEKILPGAGSLTRRYAAYDQRFLVPPDKVPAVLERALDECRRVTREQLALPEDEGVTLTYTRLMPWSAYADYQGNAKTVIRVNMDYGLTVDRAFNLACHEAYPGHHTINTLIDTRLVGPLKRVELTVQPLFSPQSLRTEGAATYAPEVAFSDAERAAFQRDVLFPLAGLDPAGAERYVRVSRLVARLDWHQVDVGRQYIDRTLDFARAAWALEERALMAFPDATLKFFNEFRSYGVTYTVGRDIVERAVNADGPDRAARWKNYERWITTVR
jgi:hypothetical protein